MYGCQTVNLCKFYVSGTPHLNFFDRQFKLGVFKLNFEKHTKGFCQSFLSLHSEKVFDITEYLIIMSTDKLT